MELNLLTLEETATLRNLLSHATHIVICAHKSPDGDAIGSSLAWMHYLKQTGKTDVRVCMPDATPPISCIGCQDIIPLSVTTGVPERWRRLSEKPTLSVASTSTRIHV